jgi:hypothetical protein
MTVPMLWVLGNQRRWHAWAKGGVRSLCGLLTRDDLQAMPAKAIAAELPDGVQLCRGCRTKLGPLDPTALVLPKSITSGTSAAEWFGFLRRHLVRASVHLNDEDQAAFAIRLAALGSCADPDALAIFDQVRELLLTPRGNPRTKKYTAKKIIGFKKSLAALPPHPQALARVASAMRAWHRITGRRITGNTKFASETVIAAMLEVPAPEPYIAHLFRSGVSELAMIFHPNTLARHKHTAALRGVFGGGTDYWTQTADQLAHQTITDEEDGA